MSQTSLVMGLLVAADLVLLFALYGVYVRGRRHDASQLLASLEAEKTRLFAELDRVRAETQELGASKASELRQAQQLASEVDLSVQRVNEQLAAATAGCLRNIEGARAEAEASSEVLLGQLRTESERSTRVRQRLAASLTRAEVLARFFADELPYDQVVRDFELQRYTRARELWREGASRQAIAAETGLCDDELDMVEGIAGQQGLELVLGKGSN